ncbi:MAG: SRPBCC family protein [Rhodospirillales bacterium]|nr:SRPBCC family protein [Rhodospirillales bacterium]
MRQYRPASWRRGGRRRRLRLVDGGEITEELETFDGQRRMYSYSIVAGSLPVSDYRSTVSVNRAGEESTIEWTTTFKPLGVAESEISQSLEDFYQAGFDNLRKLLGIPR